MIEIELNELVKESYYYNKNGMLLNGDTIEYMNKLPDKSIDMIICDLPYGTTQNKWDSIIPLDELWKQYERIIKDRGMICLTSSEPFTTKLISSNYKLFKYDLVWDKKSTTGFLNAKRMPLRRHEQVLCFYKKLPVYNPEMETRGKPRNKGNYNKKEGNGDMCYGKFENISSFNNTYYPTSILEFSNANQKDKFHPTQKPVELFEYLIRTYTNEDMIVLDNTSGSGTTAIAAENTNRKWICIEKEKEYCDVTVKRLKNLHDNAV